MPRKHFLHRANEQPKPPAERLLSLFIEHFSGNFFPAEPAVASCGTEAYFHEISSHPLSTDSSVSSNFIFSTNGSRCERTRLTSLRGHHMMLNKQKIIFPHIKRNRLSLSFHPLRDDGGSRVNCTIAHSGEDDSRERSGFAFFRVFLKCPEKRKTRTENKVENFKVFDLLESDSKATSRLTLLDIFARLKLNFYLRRRDFVCNQIEWNFCCGRRRRCQSRRLSDWASVVKFHLIRAMLR